MHPFVLLKHSEAVLTWSGIDLVALFELSLETFHALRSWVFVENLIHDAPNILNRVDIWRIWGSAYFRVKIWHVFVEPWLGGLGCMSWCPLLDQCHDLRRAARCLSVRSGFFCCLNGLHPSVFLNLQVVFSLSKGLCSLTVVRAALATFTVCT